MDSIPNSTPADIETVRQLVHQKYQETIQIRYRQIMNETMVCLDSNANLAADQFSIDTSVANSTQFRGPVI